MAWLTFCLFIITHILKDQRIFSILRLPRSMEMVYITSILSSHKVCPVHCLCLLVWKYQWLTFVFLSSHIYSRIKNRQRTTFAKKHGNMKTRLFSSHKGCPVHCLCLKVWKYGWSTSLFLSSNIYSRKKIRCCTTFA